MNGPTKIRAKRAGTFALSRAIPRYPGLSRAIKLAKFGERKFDN